MVLFDNPLLGTLILPTYFRWPRPTGSSSSQGRRSGCIFSACKSSQTFDFDILCRRSRPSFRYSAIVRTDPGFFGRPAPARLPPQVDRGSVVLSHEFKLCHLCPRLCFRRTEVSICKSHFTARIVASQLQLAYNGSQCKRFATPKRCSRLSRTCPRTRRQSADSRKATQEPFPNRRPEYE